MRSMIDGLTGWAKMDKGRSEKVRATDTAITIVGTLLVAVTWMLLRP